MPRANALMPIETMAALRTAEPLALPDRPPGRTPPGRFGESSALDVALHNDLAAVEGEWRQFERTADCTPFQQFDWLAAWHRQIGARDGVLPVIALVRHAGGELACIWPLAVVASRLGRKLCWLGQGLCDYNAPLLARDFPQRVTADRFVAAWHGLRCRLQEQAPTRHHVVNLEQMPECVGGQINPFTSLDVALNASGAHWTRLGADWQKFYAEKRSSATRRCDRAKIRHMSRYGEIRFVNCIEPEDLRRTLDVLIEQKARWLAGIGAADLFRRPGLREFLFDLASNRSAGHFVHISRIDIGPVCMAANLGLVLGDCYYHVLTSYDRDLEASRYGPGTLHLRKLMEHAISLGLRRFDFTVGDEPYKREWADRTLKLFDHTTAATWTGGPAARILDVRRRLKRAIKQSPLLWPLLYRLRAAALGRRSGKTGSAA